MNQFEIDINKICKTLEEKGEALDWIEVRSEENIKNLFFGIQKQDISTFVKIFDEYTIMVDNLIEKFAEENNIHMDQFLTQKEYRAFVYKELQADWPMM